MISREHAKEVLENLINHEDVRRVLLRTDIDAIKCAISVLSENKGEWISTEDRPFGFCSKCDKDMGEASTPYCPYCGAKMTWVGAIREPYKKGE